VEKITAFVKKLLHSKIFYVFIVIVIAVIGVGFFVKTKNVKPSITAVVAVGNLKEELVLSGEINAQDKTNLFFPTSGKISWIGVKEGDNVKKYQTLATLDQASVMKSLQSSLLDYNKQRNAFDQLKDDKNVQKPQDAANNELKRILENNQYDLDKAVLSVELKDLAKKDSVITSPIEGLVTNIANYFPGNNIVAGVNLFEVINPNTIYFSALADQTEVVKLSEGQTCEITLDSFDGEKINGIIKHISFTPDVNESGTEYRIDIEVNKDNLNSKFRLGMSGDATFITDEKENTLYIPSKFVKSDDKGTYVLAGKKKEKKYIKTGLETDDNTEVTEGLNSGDIVYD
jgi:HlyD family secretion protein